MKRHRSGLACAVVVAFLFLAEAPSEARWAPYDDTFRISVACSDLVVVGRVILTADSDARTRFSLVEVERSLHGSAATGDSLWVSWTAPFFKSSDGSTEGFTTVQPGSQLNALTGVRALYFLRQVGDGLRLASESPLELTPDNARAIRARVSWIRAPKSDDLLARALDAQHSTAVRWGCDTSDAATLRLRLEAVADYLEGYLDGLGSRSED